MANPVDDWIKPEDWVKPGKGEVKRKAPPKTPGSALEAAWQGLLHGAGNIPVGAKEIAGAASPADVKAREQAYKTDPTIVEHPFAAGAGEFVGESALPAALGAVAAVPAGAAARLGLSTLGGGIAGALQPTTREGVGERAVEGIGGAAAGAATAGLGGAIGHVLAPKLGADAATMAAQKVPLTPGRMVSGPLGRAARATEDKMTSWPGIGDFIVYRKNRTLDGFGKASINQALLPIGRQLPPDMKMGRDAITFMDDATSAAYDNVFSQVPRVNPDVTLQNFAAKMERDLRLQPGVWNKFKGEWNTAFLDAKPLGTAVGSGALKMPPLTGDNAWVVASRLNTRGRAFLKDKDQYTRDLGKAMLDTRYALIDAIERQHPSVVPELRNANLAYAMAARVGDASIRRAGSDGKITPLDLVETVKQQAQGVRRSEFRHGDALMQGWAEAAQRLLPSQYPDSGTAGRSLFSWLALAFAGGVGVEHGLPLSAVAGAGAAAGGYHALGAEFRSRVPGAVRAGAAELFRRGGAAAAPAAGGMMGGAVD